MNENNSPPPSALQTPPQAEYLTLSDSSPESVGLSTHLRIASLADLQYVIDLSKKFTNQIGFLPRAAIEWYLANNRVCFALENGDPCGFILGRTHLRWNKALRPITQAAIQFDAQKRHHGLAIVEHAADMAQLAGQHALQAMCRDGLDANDFWKIAGFKLIGSYLPGNARSKLMHCWRKPITINPPAWFDVMPPVAGWKAKKTHVKEEARPHQQLQLFLLPPTFNAQQRR